MSEDEKTACRLTYKEGMRIAELAQEPFSKAKRATFYMATIGFAAIFAMMTLGNIFPPEVNPEAIEAGFTTAQWDYIREGMNAAIAAGAILGLAFSLLTLQIALTVLQSGIVKGWLKAANEGDEKE